MFFAKWRKTKPDIQSVQVRQEIHEKGIIYFYGNEKTEKDLMLAEQYFKKERTNKKRTEAYLLLISLLNDPEKEVEQKDLVSALKICQQDVCDFWSAYFLSIIIFYGRKTSRGLSKYIQRTDL
ncbi:MAG: hypothetical protein ACLVI9_07055 [Anaerostipes hadrus]